MVNFRWSLSQHPHQRKVIRSITLATTTTILRKEGPYIGMCDNAKGCDVSIGDSSGISLRKIIKFPAIKIPFRNIKIELLVKLIL